MMPLNPTLTEVLACMGLFHWRAATCGLTNHNHHVGTRAGRVLFTGSAHQVWGWLGFERDARAGQGTEDAV